MERDRHPDAVSGGGEIIEHNLDPPPSYGGHLAGPPRQVYGRPDPPRPRQAERFLAAPASPDPPPPADQPGRVPLRRFFDLLLVAATAAALVAVVFVLRDLLMPADRAPLTQPPVATSPGPVASASGSPDQPRAAALTLRAGDLPAGYRAVQAGPAQFGGGNGTAPDSWDVVFQSGEPASRDFRAVESIVLIYATADAAAGGLRREQSAEPARGARQLVAGDVGLESQVWEEPLSGSPDYRLIRVLFRVGRAMSEVTVAAPAGPAQAREAVRLATIQAERLAGI